MAVSPIHVGVTTRCNSTRWASPDKLDSSPMRLRTLSHGEKAKTPFLSTLSTDVMGVNEHENTLCNPATAHIV